MTEQIASGFVLVAGLFVAAAIAGYVMLNRPHADPRRRRVANARRHGMPMLR